VYLNPHSLMCDATVLDELVAAVDEYEIAFFASATAAPHNLDVFQGADYPWHRPPKDGARVYPNFAVMTVRNSTGAQELVRVWKDVFRWWHAQPSRGGAVKVTPALWAALWEVVAQGSHLLRVKVSLGSSAPSLPPRPAPRCPLHLSRRAC
jgi:hypothetical protein